jgi:hypothetical protein
MLPLPTLPSRIYLIILISFFVGMVDSAPLPWPDVETLPAYPGVRHPHEAGFPGVPEVLRHFDFEGNSPEGPAVENPLQWWASRRPEILSMLRFYMYGEEPPPPADLQFTVESIDPMALGGLAVKKVLHGSHGPSGRAPFRFAVYMPKNQPGPFPTLLALNKLGDTEIEPGGERANRWDLIGAMNRGVAIATISSNNDLASDGGSFRNHLIQPYADAGFDGDWKTIAAWAWGLSRVMDYLVTDPDIDAFRVGVTGFSRRGKTALWAGALDDRFALVIPHQSGHGGAHSNRKIWGDTYGTQFPHWFLDRYTYRTDEEYDQLPYDQHFVMALSAPRTVLLSENSSYGDGLDGMLGQQAAARPAWSLLGADPAEGVQLKWDFTTSAHKHEPRHWADAYDAVLDLPRGGLEGFRLWAEDAGLIAGEADEAAIRAAMEEPLPGGNGPALEAYWLGREPSDGFSSALELHRDGQERILLSLPQRRDGIGLAGKGSHWRGIEQWLEVADDPAGPWQTIVPQHLQPLQWLDEGHPHAVRVVMEDQSPQRGKMRFYRLRYALRHQDDSLLLIRHPKNITVNEGESATFTAQLRGHGAVATQWWFEDEPISGASETFFTVEAAVPMDAGTYRFRAETLDGVLSSVAATLTVIPNSTAAEVVSARFLSPEFVELRFSEPVAQGTGATGAENPDNYSFSDGVVVQSARLMDDAVTVLLEVRGADIGQSTALTAGGIANRAATPVISGHQSRSLRQTAVAHINFQPEALPVPLGWMGDHGALFANRGNGFSYGWLGPPGTARRRDQPVSPNLQHDTLIHAGPHDYADDPDWSIALPNGTYLIRLVMGDPEYFENDLDMRVEGNALIAGSASRDLRWLEGVAAVEVTDGELTLSQGPGARRNKLCFIEIRIP